MSASLSAGATSPHTRVVEIAPSRGWRSIDFRELWDYRELLHILVWRDLKVRYRQTLLGVIWIVAQPLLTMLIFTLLFNRVAGIAPDSRVPYPLFVMTALVTWNFFSSGVAASGNSLIGSAHLISKVYFPRMMVPAASVAAVAVDLAVTLAIVAVMMLWYGVPPSWSALVLPPLIVVIAAFTFGAGLWLSALNVEFRDVRVIVPFVLQLWMFATPVFYPLRALPPRYRAIVRWNPIAPLIDGMRNAILGGPIPWTGITWAVVFTLFVLAGGAYYFRRMERRFADIL